MIELKKGQAIGNMNNTSNKKAVDMASGVSISTGQMVGKSNEKTISNPLLQTPALKVWKGDISLQQGIKEAKKQEELRTTIPSRTYSPNQTNGEVAPIDKIFLDDAKQKLAKGENLNASERKLISKYGLYGISTLQTNQIFDLFSNDNPQNTSRLDRIKVIKEKEDKGIPLTDEEKDFVETTRLINSLKKGYASNLITLSEDPNQNANNASIMGAMKLYNDAAYEPNTTAKNYNRAKLYADTGFLGYFEGVANSINATTSLITGINPEDAVSKDTPQAIANSALKQYYQQNGEQVNSFIQDIAVNMAQNAIPMLMAMAGGIAGGAANGEFLSRLLSSTTMAPSVFGNAYKEGVRLGINDQGKLLLYSSLSTASEIGLEYLLGSVPNTAGGVVTGELIESVSKSVSNVLLKATLKTFGNAVGEFTEESIQGIISPLLQRYILGADVDTIIQNPIDSLSEAAYSGLVGFVTSVLTGSYSNIQSSIAENAIQQNGKIYNEIIQELDLDINDIATFFKENSQNKEIIKTANEIQKGDHSDLTVGEFITAVINDAKQNTSVLYATIGQKVATLENGVETIMQTYETAVNNGAIFSEEIGNLYYRVKENFDNKNIDTGLIGEFAFKLQSSMPRAQMFGQLTERIIEEQSSQTNAENSLQNSADNDIISNNEQVGDEINVGQQDGNNSERLGRTIHDSEGQVGTVQENLGRNYDQSRTKGIQQRGSSEVRNQGNNRRIEPTAEQKESLKTTAIKDENGNPKVVSHFTDNMDFDTFEKGDIGFHFGNEQQALERGRILKKQGRIIKAYLDIKNPLNISTDLMTWSPINIAFKLSVDGIISQEQYNQIKEMQFESGASYNSPAAVELRKILGDLGYDGIVYENMFEADGESYIAFYPEQVIIIDDGKNQADPNGPANFMPEVENEGEVGRADGDIADFGGIDTARGKHLNKVQQDEITAIGEKLDRKVVYEDFYNLDKFKGKKKIPDGYLAKDGTVHINYFAKRPIYFLFKHEITHYLKKSLASYNDFMNLVIDSNAFKDWLDRNGYSSIDTLKTEIMDTYSEVEDFDEGRCYDEILANFVGEYLFGGENAVSQKLINALEPKQKKTFREVISDIINYFKSKFQKNKPIQTEIDKIENEFIKVYKEAVEVEVDEGSSQATEEMYSISKTTNNVPVIVVNDDILRNVINEKELIDIVKKSLGKFKRVPIKGQNIYFVSDTKNEYLNSKYSQYLKKNQKQTYYDKMRLSSHPQDIVYATTNYINEGLNHPRKDNIIDFARGNILVDISGRKYSAEVVIGFTKSGICELHDIVKMLPTSFEYKKEATSESMDSNESTRSDVTSINKIPHKEDSVNNNFMLDSEDYSIPSTTNAESLLESYENGEISRQEYLNALRKEKTLNPLEIANLSERDADTTPEHAKKKGESKGNGESNTYNSLLESDIFDDTFKKEMKESSFVKKYATVTNEETLKTAAKELDEGGLNYVNKWWSIKPERASLIDTAIGFILMDRYQRIGDYQSAVAAAEKVREFGTASGQQVQIFSVLGRLDPNTMVVYAQKELSKAFDEMVKTRTQKWIDKNADKFNLTDNELEFIRRRTLQAAKLPEGRDKAIKLAEIATLLQDKLPPQKGEGLKTLQRMSMLLNAKTNIRNITGNVVMAPVFIFSDFFGSGIDKWVSTKTGVRTTGNFDRESLKGIKKGAFETMDDFRRHINTRNSEMNRFEIGSGKAFNEHHDGKLAKQLDEVAKILNALDRFTSFCLEMGDRPFYEMWFINSLNNQMKLNDVSEATPEMVAIASSEALQRTWQDTNKVVKAVAGTKNTLNYISIGGYGLGDVLIKFTKTPANLTKAIFDFSPAGLIKSIVSDGLTLRNAVKKGSFKPKMQKQFVDSLSKGITGTLLYILAASLASAGVLGGGGDEDKDVSDFEKYIQGIPEYSFKFAGKWWSYEWMQPVGAIAATVTDYMKSKENNPDNNFFENTLEAIKAGGEVLYNQSFMKSIQNLFTADNIVDGLIDAILDDPSVYIPQLLSQVANVTDKYRRTTYEKNKPLENALNRVKVKIPGLRQTLPKSVDVLGREIPNSQKGIFNAFFNPANTFTDTSTPVTDHVYELYTKTKNKTLMPRVAPYSITIKGITKNFTPEEKNDFQRISGATASDILEIAFKSDGYKKLSDEQKVEFINDVYGFATKMAKSSIEYDYTTLSAIVGEYPDGKPILSESDYKKLPEGAREMLVQEYFFNKTEIRFLDDYKGLINHYINQATK